MISVKQILDEKGHRTWSVAPEDTLYDAVQLMAEKDVGALMVLQEGRLKGIVTERDYARKGILQGRASKETPVSEIMTSNVLCARLNQSVEECMALMTDKRVRHLPVVEEDGRVEGIVSIGDTVKAVIAEQKFIIEQLENYITG
jgi:CBS domain-containing protein